MKKIRKLVVSALTISLISSLTLDVLGSTVVKANTNKLNVEASNFKNSSNVVYLKNIMSENMNSNYYKNNLNETTNELTINYNISKDSEKSDENNEPTIQKSEVIKLISKDDLQKDFNQYNSTINDNTVIWIDVEYLNDTFLIEKLIHLFNLGNKLIFVGENINQYEEKFSQIFGFENIPYNVEGNSLSGRTLMPMGFLIEKLNDGSTNTCSINVEGYKEENEVLGALLGASQEEKLNDKYLEEKNKGKGEKASPSTSRSGYDDWRTARVYWDLYIDREGYTNGNPRYQVVATAEVNNRNELDPNRYMIRGLNQIDLRIDDMDNNKIRIQKTKPAEKQQSIVGSLSLGFGYPWSINVGLSFNRNATNIKHTLGGREHSKFAANFWPVGHYPSKFEAGISAEVENKGPSSMPIKMSYTIEMMYMDVINNTSHFAKGSEYWTWRSDW